MTPTSKKSMEKEETLRELIEKCGAGFEFLSYGAGWKTNGERNLPDSGNLWKAYGGLYGKAFEAFWDKTPEGAVKQLLIWLQQQKDA
jgi:hypothetical protein